MNIGTLWAMTFGLLAEYMEDIAAVVGMMAIVYAVCIAAYVNM